MQIKQTSLIALLLSVLAGTSLASDVSGYYECTIVEKATIASAHTEGSGPPKAFISKNVPTRFRMQISRLSDSVFKMTEVDYDGPYRDPVTWHTEKSVLHSEYIGDGVKFASEEDQAFVRLHETIHENEDGNLSFGHSGFEWAGGEDSHLSVRWGRCKRVKTEH